MNYVNNYQIRVNLFSLRMRISTIPHEHKNESYFLWKSKIQEFLDYPDDSIFPPLPIDKSICENSIYLLSTILDVVHWSLGQSFRPTINWLDDEGDVVPVWSAGSLTFARRQCRESAAVNLFTCMKYEDLLHQPSIDASLRSVLVRFGENADEYVMFCFCEEGGFYMQWVLLFSP